jgi:exosome complex component RRP42
MDKVILTSNLTAERIKKYLLENRRFDERGINDFREIKIETPVSIKAEGSARVKIGKTEVLVGVKMGVSEPYSDSPDKGNLMVTAELLPLSSPRFQSGPPKFPSIELGRLTDRVLRESKLIEFEKLCIKKGEKVWTIFVDIYSINDDGNLLDAATIGSIIALKNSRIPKYDEKEDRVLYGEWTDKKIPLSNNIPLSVTFYKIGKKFVVDPTREEEDVSDLKITIGSYNGFISSIQKGNSQPISIDEMNNVIDLNEKVWKDIFKKIEKFLI